LKQLAPIGPNGEALFEYSAFDASRAGFGRVVLVVRPEAEAAFHERLDSRMAKAIPVSYVHQRVEADGGGFPERTKPWGTGHALLALESEVEGPFAVVNADDFYGAESYVDLARFLGEGQTARRLAAVGFRLAETLTDAGAVSRAVLDVDDEARLRSIVECLEVWRQGDRIVYRDDDGRERAFVGDEWVSMNMWGLTPELLPELRRRFADFVTRFGLDPASEFRLPEVIETLVAEGLFEVEILPGGREWCGITFRDDEERVRSIVGSMIAQGRYPRALWG
jgi:hypothetical protein